MQILSTEYFLPNGSMFNKSSKLLKAIDVGKPLKIVADVVSPSLTGVSTQSILTAISPFDWKLAKMSPIFKNGSKPDLNNYLNCCPCRSQNFWKNCLWPFYHYLNENGLLNNCQSGFLSLHSTLATLLQTNDNWCVNIDRGLLKGAVSRQSSSFCLILPITHPQSLWNLK